MSDETIDVITAEGTGTTGIWAPLVTGELPGPVPIANTDGTFIMVKVDN